MLRPRWKGGNPNLFEHAILENVDPKQLCELAIYVMHPLLEVAAQDGETRNFCSSFLNIKTEFLYNKPGT